MGDAVGAPHVLDAGFTQHVDGVVPRVGPPVVVAVLLLADEIGDLLFSVANLARHCDVDAEAALRGTNSKFVRRFRAIEKALSEGGRDIEGCSLDEMETLWVEAKRAEKLRP